MLCESKQIYKNPKYRVIRYNDEYFMIDLVSTWITYFLPMINWFVPKKYAKISEKEFESLNIIKPVKNNIFWPVAGSSVLFGIILRKYGNFFNVQFEKKLAITVFFIMLIGMLIFYFYLNKKLKLKIFNTNVVNKNRIVLIPTFKQGCLIVFAYIFLGSASIFTLTILLTTESQNIIIFITWVIITMFFFLVNMASIGNEKVHVIMKNN
ncbi:TPA: DUF443 family protein [Staphylococcus aureus]|uniref:DUF443 family protein n=2 Tax=Staphylococcus aureus TaxID=1280 RepID=UPI0001DD94EC|nr:DUF443 family protein [Staphylococcus aureus]HDJ6917331.1 DUF443 family protein [Staphylococcus aureus Sa_TPS3169]HDJ6920143.1 DUF443 family protein [Staphylococcus aureus Sa_TPS3162]HDJ6928447.1 DUF443 family protein [Staphylococcus aureus Sa_TPS3157]HDJ6930845.1 DUF443 family protein [Staphylococcus aureus Sa_TPS3148]HDJ6936625.1 DUF443 family protein [Staphylococcus aureus Sa_TPS3161]HDJ6942004.1 DUF443 family protein [Staphylococcus aureus Sa_TPS3174]HDJ6947586.1 DUF443 family protein